jgi:hypothetical protein
MYVTDWSQIDRNKQYIVFAVNYDTQGKLYLSKPTKELGWQVLSLRQNLYVALELPDPKPILESIEKQWNSK